MAVVVVTDSTSYLPLEMREQYGIEVVTLYVNFGNESFPEMGIENDWFYSRMAAEKEIPTSSQPSVKDMYDAFSRVLDAGNEVCGVFISSDMSGTLESARMAAEMLKNERPDVRIELVDSRANSMQLGLVALEAARVASAGATLEEVAQAARATTPRTRFLFVPHTLEYLRRGGRIGGASALIGSLLQVRPILTVKDGKTEVWNKVRTKKRALAEMVEVAKADADRVGIAEIVVHHINDIEEGRAFAAEVSQALGREAMIVDIGPVVGLHVGPGTVALVYRTERDV